MNPPVCELCARALLDDRQICPSFKEFGHILCATCCYSHRMCRKLRAYRAGENVMLARQIDFFNDVWALADAADYYDLRTHDKMHLVHRAERNGSRV